MKKYIISLIILVASCSNEHTQHVISIHDDIINQDLHNKQRELEILREIRIAQSNRDEEAYKFFMQEYMDIPRLKLTAEQKQHPNFKEWLTDEVIKSGEFMDSSYNYME